jgi:hypothetical protein
MNNYYAKINFPNTTTIFKNLDELINFKNVEAYKVFNSDVLSDSAIKFFKSINVSPAFVVMFDNPNLRTKISDNERCVHSDIALDKNNKWKYIYCGINWEIYPDTEVIFNWWDMTGAIPVWPLDIPTEDQYKVINGVHYNKRKVTGVPLSAKHLESIHITEPTLIRTDIPHTVSYNSTNSPRIGVTLRFEETWTSWEECLEIFKPIISYTQN